MVPPTESEEAVVYKLAFITCMLILLILVTWYRFVRHPQRGFFSGP